MPQHPELPTVDYVDLQRYLGLWYEIARLPMWAEDTHARDVTAEYSLLPDGRIRVVNSCLDAEGELDTSEGVAEVVDSTSNAKLEVSFLPKALRWLPVARGDYWILKLDARYNTALVGTPNRKYLWLLSRNAQLDARTRLEFLEHAQALGFDLDKLIFPEQSGVVPRGDSMPAAVMQNAPTLKDPRPVVTHIQDLWLLEEQFWTADVPYYDAALAKESVMVFARPVGVLDRAGSLAGLGEGPRWSEVVFTQQQLLTPKTDVAILTYHADAKRAGAEDFSADCMSVYVKQSRQWMLVAHQQMPGWVDLEQGAPAE